MEVSNQVSAYCYHHHGREMTNRLFAPTARLLMLGPREGLVVVAERMLPLVENMTAVLLALVGYVCTSFVVGTLGMLSPSVSTFSYRNPKMDRRLNSHPVTSSDWTTRPSPTPLKASTNRWSG